MLPIGDDTPRYNVPYVTLTFLVVNVLVFLYQQSLGEAGFERLVRAYGTVPFEITNGVDIGPKGPSPVYWTLLTSMFMHANFMHLGGNMLFLWIFGDNVEDRMGHLGYLLFYLLCGLAASGAQIALDADGLIPGIGASGAIAGVLGAYLVLFPGATVRTLSNFGLVHVPAWLMLGFWILTQVLAGMAQWGGEKIGGVAYAAHVGGFVAGLVLVQFFAARSNLGAPPSRYLPRRGWTQGGW